MWVLIAAVVALAVYYFVVVKKPQKAGAGAASSSSSTSSTSSKRTKASLTEDDFVEEVLCNVKDLPVGEMKEFTTSAAGTKVLLSRDTTDDVYATSAKCTHYGAPLKNGAFGNQRVRCPWHGACFNVKTGDVEDFPCGSKLASYAVKIDARTGDIRVKVPTSREAAKAHEHQDTVGLGSCEHGASDKSSSSSSTATLPVDGSVVIVGGGAAAAMCARTLREGGFKGTIDVISREKDLPYDRPKLSKSMSVKVDKILLHDADFYRGLDIRFRLGVSATELDVETRSLTLSDGSRIEKADYVVIATGGDPRVLPIEGMSLESIFQLRVPAEAHGIVKAVGKDNDKRVVIVGSSFIGMEAAASVVKNAKSVDVIGMETVPFERVLGKEIGAAMQKLHESKGVRFHMECVVKKFEESSDRAGHVARVVLSNGSVLEADLCIVGAGVVPATKFVKPSDNLEICRDGSLMCDTFLSCAENVYACGDIARFPYWKSGANIRVEHWGMAMYQGRVAALNILKKKSQPMESIPFFWTSAYGKSIRYAGHAHSYNKVVIGGSCDKYDFTAFFVNDEDKVLAVAGIGRDAQIAAAAELLAADALPPVATLEEDPDVDLVALLASTH